MKTAGHDPARTRYDEEWRQYRRNRRAMWVLLLAWIPFWMFVVLPVLWLTNSENPGYGIAIFWVAAFVIFAFRAGNFRCPRCGKRFFVKWGFRHDWSSKCLHCGLPKWAD